MADYSIDGKEIVVRIIKYVLEGAMVALAAYLIPQKKSNPEEILTIALVAAATFSLLDMFAPSISNASRFGVGTGIGLALTPVGQGLMK